MPRRRAAAAGARTLTYLISLIFFLAVRLGGDPQVVQGRGRGPPRGRAARSRQRPGADRGAPSHRALPRWQGLHAEAVVGRGRGSAACGLPWGP
jgi:hypothetical protein